MVSVPFLVKVFLLALRVTSSLYDALHLLALNVKVSERALSLPFIP